jgi:hypothetical protein
MRENMKKIVISVAVLFCLSSALFAEEVNMPPLGYPSTISNGLGGPHVAYTDNVYSLFVNPAALQWANEMLISDITFGFTGPIDKLLKKETRVALAGIKNAFGGDDTNSLSNSFTAFTDIMEGGKLPMGADMRGPLSFAYTANGFGIGLFTRTVADARIIGTDVDMNLYLDFTLPFGMVFNIVKLKDHELSTGFVLKPFVRLWSTKEISALDLMDFDFNELGLEMPLIVGGGADLGFMYRFRKDLVVGLTAKDVYTAGAKVHDVAAGLDMGGGGGSSTSSNTTYRIPLALNTGIAYTFRPSSFWKMPPVLQSFYTAFVLDWSNSQNVFTWNNREHRNPLLDLGAGMEIGLFNFFKFRIGIHELLPSVGFGFEPAVFKLNLAVYGKELGAEPGINTTMGFDLSISFRPDTKKRNWVWSKPLIK